MARVNVLIDSCTYFRLAKSLHPLLNQPIGSEPYVLYLNEYMIRQFERSDRLQSKFQWVKDPQFVSNRNAPLQVTPNTKKEINDAYDYIWETQKDLGYSLLYDDIFCLAYGQILGITVVSDDTGMHATAGEYGIKILTTLELLALLHTKGYIDQQKIIEIVEYWKYNKDLPKNFARDFKKLFPEIKLSFL